MDTQLVYDCIIDVRVGVCLVWGHIRDRVLGRGHMIVRVSLLGGGVTRGVYTTCRACSVLVNHPFMFASFHYVIELGYNHGTTLCHALSWSVLCMMAWP